MKELCLVLTGRISRLGSLLRVILPQQPGELLQLRIRIKCNVQHALAALFAHQRRMDLGILPPANCLVMACIISNCFSSRLMSTTWVPDPAAMRRLRLELSTEGSRAHTGSWTG